MVLVDASTAPPGTHTAFFSLKTAAAVPCGPAATSTSPDDDEHNTDSNFLLLFADVGITPTLLEGLTEVDVLHIAPWLQICSGHIHDFEATFFYT